MNRFTPVRTAIDGLSLIDRKVVSDQRGSFQRLFCAEELACVGWASPVAQINLSTTALRGTIRGMHYQRTPHAEMKLVTCLKGRAFDVAVDLRVGSATFLNWFAAELSEDNDRSILIPEGFAHGFQALTNNVQLLYCHSTLYAIGAEGGFHHLDERVAIEWPLPVSRLSTRDGALPFLPPGFEGLDT